MTRYVKSPVGAHYGLGDWLLQRLTAVVMVLYTLGFVFILVTHTPDSYADWKRIFTNGVVRVGTMLFFISLLYHAWIGMRDILMDYIQPMGLRLTLQTGVALLLLLYLVWTASILWGR